MRVLASLRPDAVVEERVFGGAAIHSTGDPLPAETLDACRDADAVLLGAVGLPEFDGAAVRPEQGLIRLRGELDVYANLRPTRGGEIDLLIVRELVGGLYFGASGRRPDGSAYDTCEYSPAQVERIARRGFELAGARRGLLTSVDKANVLETSRLWREVVVALAPEYLGVRLEHVLVDTAGLQLVQDPSRFDVIVTENTFGDILSDVAAGTAGVSASRRRRASAIAVRASSSLSTAPRPISPAGASPTPPPRFAPPHCCCATAPATRRRRTRSTGRSTRRSSRRRRRTSAARPRPASSPTRCCARLTAQPHNFTLYSVMRNAPGLLAFRIVARAFTR